MPGRKRRIALYSHDTCGLGHMRRNLLIAEALTRMPGGADVLLITGAPEAQGLVLSEGVDTLTLPSLYKSGNGRYRPRFFSFGVQDLIDLRARAIRGALEIFQPDLFIVDKVASGVMDELTPSLVYLKRETKTRCVLGLRDILDQPETVMREWQQERFYEVVDRYYAAIWIYGDAQVYDAQTAYQMPDVLRQRVQYTGYLDQSKRMAWVSGEVRRSTQGLIPEAPFFVCTVGGGQDGYRVADHFIRAPRPAGTQGVVLTGPFMPPDEVEALQRRCQDRNGLHLMRRLAEPTLLYEAAEGIVCMGGYNTLGEVLSLGKPALVIPRVAPRAEQRIRATRLAELGLVQVMHPQQASPEALGNWLAHPVAGVQAGAHQIRFTGLDRIVQEVGRMFPWPSVLQTGKVYAS